MKKSILILFAFAFMLMGCKKTETTEEEKQEEQIMHFKVLDERGNTLENNAEFVFNDTGNSAQLRLSIQNVTDKQIKIKTKLVETDVNGGNEFEVCVGGSCYPSMQLNVEYPINTDFIIEAHETTPPDDIHYTNFYSVPCYYKVEIYEVDDNGDKVGEAFTFKYIYQQ